MKAQRDGFTLFEALLSIALLVVLAVGVVVLIGDLTREVAAELADDATLEPAWLRLFDSHLQADLESATGVRILEDEIACLTHRSLHHGMHELVWVKYRVTRTRSESWLVRFERRVESLAIDDTHGEVVASGVGDMRVDGAPPTRRFSTEAFAREKAMISLPELAHVPSTMKLRLFPSDSSCPPWTRVIHVR